MWLAISAIVLATAIGCNVLALWLTDWFLRNHPEIARAGSGMLWNSMTRSKQSSAVTATGG